MRARFTLTQLHGRKPLAGGVTEHGLAKMLHDTALGETLDEESRSAI
ncbi:MAG: hypothetical protein ACPHP7_06955 [Planctomycetota bacterium]